MSSTKIVVIVLVLVVVLFVVVTVYGSRKNASGTTTAKNFNLEDYPGLETLSRLLPSYGPKLEPEQMKQGPKVFERGAHLQFDLPLQPITIQILPDDDHKFRKAMFTLTPPDCAVIQYKAEGDVDPNLKNQTWPTEDSRQREKGTFWILKSNGTLTLSRKQLLGGPCRVTLE